MEQLQLAPLKDAYTEINEMLDKAAIESGNKVFVYEDPTGNKNARSHVYGLRKIKAAIEKKRKELKASALEFGRGVDGAAKELTARVEEMIEVHEVPLLAIENRERERVAALEARLAELTRYKDASPDATPCAIKNLLDDCEAIAIDPSWQEFMQPAQLTKDESLAYLNEILAKAEKREAEAAELERLRKEEEARKQAEREEAIRKEAAEKAKKAAEEKAAREKAEAERQAQVEREASAKREADAKAAQAAAEQARKEAEARAERAAQEERERIEAEQKAAAKREADLKAKREANGKHRAKVISEATHALFQRDKEEEGLTPENIIEAIVAGDIPHVTINF